MAYDETLRSVSLDADSSIAVYTGVPGQPGSPNPHGGKQYHFVKVTGSHTVGLTNEDDLYPVGVLQNKPQQVGAAATVAYQGISRVVADKAVAAGSPVYSSADGQGTDDASGDGPVVGIAITAAAAAGEIFAVLLTVA